MAGLAAWYSRADDADEIEQGDIYVNATIPNISAVDLEAVQEIPTRMGAFVVLTQSCDTSKAETILLAEVYRYDSLVAGPQGTSFRKTEFRNHLIRNRVEHFFLLPTYDDDPRGWSLASFRHLHVVSRPVLRRLAEERAPIRMNSPYKEYLGESFARFMMRVALPEPLDEFRDVKW